MKILLINTVSTNKNGITNVLFNYLKAMNTDGLQIDFVSINQPDMYYIKEVQEKGGRLFVLPRLSNTITYWKSLRDLIHHNKYDVVHIHGNSHTTVLELTAAKAAGCCVRIVHAHTTKCLNIVVHKLLAPLFNTLCTHGLACGEEAGKFMFGNKPFSIINNGIDTAKFSFNQKKRDFIRNQHNWQGHKVIGHVGYFSEVKNHQWIIEIFRVLADKDDYFHLVLIGDGKLKEQIIDKARKYGILDKITFTGNINNVDEYLNALDLILMPSLYEGLPLTLIEQQANGLRCVISNTITTEVDKTKNITFLPLSASAEEWAKVIDNIKISNSQERKQFSDNAICSITKSGFNIKEEADKLRNYYLQTLQ